MNFKSFLNTFLVALIISLTPKLWAQSQTTANFAQRLQSILSPYVVPLDRDLWTFRYERASLFQPQAVKDLELHLRPWALNFNDVSNLRGADTGPGVYVAMDPVATATWGGPQPAMFAIKILQGARILVGDGSSNPVLEQLKNLAKDMNCGHASTSMDDDLGHGIGYFRTNEKLECRQAVIDALQALQITGLSYSFESVPLHDCRATGTAISLISGDGIAWDQVNYYSAGHILEGNTEVTPLIKKLFAEARSDFYSQTLLANVQTWQRFQNAFGFFNSAGDVSTTDYAQWKAGHILKCGARWSVERDEHEFLKMVEIRQYPDAEVSRLLVQMSLIYRDRHQSVTPLSSGIPSELRIEKIRAVQQRSLSIDPIQSARYSYALVPVWTNNPKKDKEDYLQILRDCYSMYMDTAKSVEQIAASSCGMTGD